MLTPESYKIIKGYAESQGIEFWDVIAKATTRYLRKQGLDVKVESVDRKSLIAQRRELWNKTEEAIMEELYNLRPKGLTFIQIQEEIAKWDIKMGRTALQSRLDHLVSQGVLERVKAGALFGKPVYHWVVIKDDEKLDKWFAQR